MRVSLKQVKVFARALYLRLNYAIQVCCLTHSLFSPPTPPASPSTYIITTTTGADPSCLPAFFLPLLLSWCALILNTRARRLNVVGWRPSVQASSSPFSQTAQQVFNASAGRKVSWELSGRGRENSSTTCARSANQLASKKQATVGRQEAGECQ